MTSLNGDELTTIATPSKQTAWTGLAAQAAGAVFLASGIAFLLFRSLIAPRPEVDFRFFWLAGKVWAAGGDPYGPIFKSMGAAILPDGNVVLHWFYPPQWWAISRLLAMTDLAHALAIWRLASGAMILAGTAALFFSVADRSVWQRWALAGLACGFAALVEPTANLLAFGQSSGLVFLSLMLLATGILRQSRLIVGIALFIATFKPQVGIGLLAAMMFLPAYRLSVVAALAGAAVLALPQIVMFGPVTTIREFLDNLRQWNTLPSNTPLTASGPANLLARLGFSGLSASWQMAAALAVQCYAGWRLARAGDRPLVPLYLFMASVAALVPLHIYDLTIFMAPLMLHLAIARRPTFLAALCALAIVRPGRIEALLSVPQYGSGVSSGLIIFTLVALLFLADAAWRSRPPRFSPSSSR